jgi:hypothetical protein
MQERVCVCVEEGKSKGMNEAKETSLTKGFVTLAKTVPVVWGSRSQWAMGLSRRQREAVSGLFLCGRRFRRHGSIVKSAVGGFRFTRLQITEALCGRP